MINFYDNKISYYRDALNLNWLSDNKHCIDGLLTPRIFYTEKLKSCEEIN